MKWNRSLDLKKIHTQRKQKLIKYFANIYRDSNQFHNMSNLLFDSNIYSYSYILKSNISLCTSIQYTINCKFTVSLSLESEICALCTHLTLGHAQTIANSQGQDDSHSLCNGWQAYSLNSRVLSSPVGSCKHNSGILVPVK